MGNYIAADVRAKGEVRGAQRMAVQLTTGPCHEDRFLGQYDSRAQEM